MSHIPQIPFIAFFSIDWTNQNTSLEVTRALLYSSLYQTQFVETDRFYMLAISHSGDSRPGPQRRAIGTGSGQQETLPKFSHASHAWMYLTLKAKQCHDGQASVDAFDGTEWAQRGERIVWWIGMVGFLLWTDFIENTKFLPACWHCWHAVKYCCKKNLHKLKKCYTLL